MALGAVEIGRVARSLEGWVGAQLQGIHQPEPEALILSLRRPGRSLLLKLVCRGPLTRLHPVAERPANPLVGLPFQQLCRKELSGRLAALEQLGGDRVVRLLFSGAQDRGLVAELTGRHGNAFVLDEAGTILGSMHPNLSRRRALNPGQPWQPPAPPPGEPPPDAFADVPDGDALLAAVEARSEATQALDTLSEVRQRVAQALRREAKRQRRLLANLTADLEKAEEGESLGRMADLIQINLGRLHKGQPEAQVADIFEDPPVERHIPLRPELSPTENMARYYRLSRRYQGAADDILDRAAAAERRLGELESWQDRLDAAGDAPAIEAIAAAAGVRLRDPQQPSRRKSKDEPRRPYQLYLSSDGFEIRVGRSATNNDALTFRHSRGNDFWLHARGAPGAHVVVPCPAGPPPLTTLLEAAALALKYSGRQVGDDGDVSYTRVKHVRRVPGGPPGRVTITQDKTLYLRLEPELLGRIQRAPSDEQR